MLLPCICSPACEQARKIGDGERTQNGDPLIARTESILRTSGCSFCPLHSPDLKASNLYVCRVFALRANGDCQFLAFIKTASGRWQNQETDPHRRGILEKFKNEICNAVLAGILCQQTLVYFS
jgi:hypothetical protein